MNEVQLDLAADIATDKAYFESHPWNVYHDGFKAGARWHESLPFRDRLTPEEWELIKEYWNGECTDTLTFDEFMAWRKGMSLIFKDDLFTDKPECLCGKEQ